MNNLDQILILLTKFHEDNEMIHHWHSGIKSIVVEGVTNDTICKEMLNETKFVRNILKGTCNPTFLLNPSIITKIKLKFNKNNDTFIYNTYGIVEDSLITLNDARADISSILIKHAFETTCIITEMMILLCGALVWIDDLKKLLR